MDRGSEPRVAGFHDHSFLGCWFLACQSGVHAPVGTEIPLAYALDKGSARSVVALSYSEMSNPIRVVWPNVSLFNLAAHTPDSTGTILQGPEWLGKLVIQGRGESEPKLTLGYPNNLEGVLLEIASALDTHKYTLVRETAGPGAGWWSLRRANTWAQAVLALRGDNKESDAAAVWAPLGVMLGRKGHERAITYSSGVPTWSGIHGDIVFASAPTPSLDGWRFRGGEWIPFAWASA